MIEIKSTKMQNRNLKQALNSGLRVMKGEMATEIFFFFTSQKHHIQKSSSSTYQNNNKWLPAYT